MNSGTEQDQPGQCKREKYSGGGSPSPRHCDICLEGPCQRELSYSLSCGSETCALDGKQSDPESQFMQHRCRGCTPADKPLVSIEGIHQMQLRTKFDREGIWLYAVADELRVAIVPSGDLDSRNFEFLVPVPCLHICSTPKVSWPVGYRHAKMPEDYGKEVMFFSDIGADSGRGILRGSRTIRNSHNRLIIETNVEESMTVDSRRVFVIDKHAGNVQ